MKEISVAANLSMIYNHCIRATACTLLDSAGVETRHMYFIGHKMKLAYGRIQINWHNIKVRGCQMYFQKVWDTTDQQNPTKYLTKYKLTSAPARSGEYEQSHLPITLAESSSVQRTSSTTTVHQSSHNSNAASGLFQNCTFSGPINIQIIDNKWAQKVCVTSLFYALPAQFWMSPWGQTLKPSLAWPKTSRFFCSYVNIKIVTLFELTCAIYKSFGQVGFRIVVP